MSAVKGQIQHWKQIRKYFSQVDNQIYNILEVFSYFVVIDDISEQLQ